MRYENPHYMAEDAGAADLIASGRLQLGISRGSPEQVIDGWRYFGYRPIEGEDDAGMGRRHAEEFLELLRGRSDCSWESAAVPPSRSSMVGATLATARLKARTMQVWAGGMPKNFLSCCVADRIAVGNQPRFPRAGHRWLALLWLPPD